MYTKIKTNSDMWNDKDATNQQINKKYVHVTKVTFVIQNVLNTLLNNSIWNTLIVGKFRQQYVLSSTKLYERLKTKKRQHKKTMLYSY